MSRRDLIRMNENEVLAFLDSERTVVCATLGKDGWPHLMPLWFVVRAGTVWAWTFAKSQKTRNIYRDPRATLQLEAGTEYQELRGVMLKCDVRTHDQIDQVASVGLEILARQSGLPVAALPEEARAAVGQQAEKRVAFEFVEHDRATWDHRKLAAGIY